MQSISAGCCSWHVVTTYFGVFGRTPPTWTLFLLGQQPKASRRVSWGEQCSGKVEGATLDSQPGAYPFVIGAKHPSFFITIIINIRCFVFLTTPSLPPPPIPGFVIRLLESRAAGSSSKRETCPNVHYFPGEMKQGMMTELVPGTPQLGSRNWIGNPSYLALRRILQGGSPKVWFLFSFVFTCFFRMRRSRTTSPRRWLHHS